jgi:Ni,Fe-hydrogenase III small subunit
LPASWLSLVKVAYTFIHPFSLSTMKLRCIALLTFAMLTSAVAASAQTKLPPRRTAAPRPKVVAPAGAPTLKDGVMLKEGKVMVTQMGRTTPLTQEMSLVNGTKISPTGTIVTPAGVSTQLQEGDVVSLSGRITTSAQKAEQDSLLLVKKEDLKTKGKGKRKK